MAFIIFEININTPDNTLKRALPPLSCEELFTVYRTEASSRAEHLYSVESSIILLGVG